MAHGKNRAAWDHTSNVLAMLFNINRGKNNKPMKADDFNPYTTKASKAKGFKPKTAEQLWNHLGI